MIKRILFLEFCTFVWLSFSAFDDLFFMDLTAIFFSLLVFLFFVKIVAVIECTLFSEFLKNKIYLNVMAVLFSIVSSILLFYFFLPFSGLERYEKIVFLIVSFFLWLSQECFGGRIRKAVLSFIFIFSVLPLVLNPSSPLRQLIGDDEIIINNNIKNNNNPNLYFIGFDSLISGAASRAFFGVSTTPWKEDMNLLGWRYIDNVTAAGDDTLNAFSSILNDNAIKFRGSRGDLFGGKIKTFAAATSKLNDYTFTFTFANNFFGAHSGKWVDNFYPPRTNAIGICNVAVYYFAIFICRPDFVGFAKEFLGMTYSRFDDGNSIEHFLGLIQSQKGRQRKSVNVAYFWSPGHTNPPYNYNNKENYNNYIKLFNENSKNTISLIDRITHAIVVNDPSAIVVIFGDHGSMITRGMNSKTPIDEYLIQLDRLGVSMAIYPNNFCLESIKEGYNLTHILKDIFLCLKLPVEK